MPTCPRCQHHWTNTKKSKETVQMSILALGEVTAGQLCQGCDKPVKPGPCAIDEFMPVVWCADCVCYGVISDRFFVTTLEDYIPSEKPYNRRGSVYYPKSQKILSYAK